MNAQTVSLNVADGLREMNAGAIAVRTALDQVFVGWGDSLHAAEKLYPPLLRVGDLVRLDYFKNFPHLGVLATTIAAEHREEQAQLEPGDETAIPGGAMAAAELALPSAACFHVYLALSGQTLDDPARVSTIATCFRNEASFDATRLLAFQMRELVCVGSRDAVLEHVARAKAKIVSFANALGLPLQFETASDPFFDPRGSRALMAELFPTKQELVYRNGEMSVAIGSLNQHRNFFGERCEIVLGDGSAAYSGCVAFGIERWIAALVSEFGDDALGLVDRIREAEQTAGTLA